MKLTKYYAILKNLNYCFTKKRLFTLTYLENLTGHLSNFLAIKLNPCTK